MPKKGKGEKNMINKTYKMTDEEEIEQADDVEAMMSDNIYEQSKPSNEELDTKENIPSYELIYASKLEEGEEPLGKVIGHENQKKELLLMVDWFKRSKELKAKGVSIPKGAILYGEPGNGKSLFLKEIIRCCEAPVFIFQGEQTNVVAGICETFKKAREAGHAIIVFDELDLLINKERRVVRALQENLDGVESDDDILVLTATNYIDDIPEALMRHGRLEKLIKVPYPKGEEALELLKKHFKEFNLELPSDFDEEELALSLTGISCAGVKSVVNDIVLRNGFENITSKMIDDSIFNVTDRVKDTPEEDNLSVCVHEAGHAVMAKAFPQYFVINRINVGHGGGRLNVKEVEKGFWPYDKCIADIKVAMAGVIAQKVLCGAGSRGCESDLQTARIDAYNLFNMCGYSSCWETLPVLRQGARTDTPVKRRKMERKIERLLRKCEKETTKYIKAHQSKIMTLAKLLFEKKHLKSSEILACIG